MRKLKVLITRNSGNSFNMREKSMGLSNFSKQEIIDYIGKRMDELEQEYEP